jgi:hypothetical protein
LANYGSIKGIDQRPYDRKKFNEEFDRIFNKEGKKDGENNTAGQGAEASKGTGRNKSDDSNK